MKQRILQPVGSPCTLAECPPGLFLFVGPDNEVGFKGGREEIYTVGSGDYFWGNGRVPRWELIVQPCRIERVEASVSPTTDAAALSDELGGNAEQAVIINHVRYAIEAQREDEYWAGIHGGITELDRAIKVAQASAVQYKQKTRIVRISVRVVCEFDGPITDEEGSRQQ